MIDACDYGMGLGRRNDLHVRTVDDAHGIVCDSHHHFLRLDLLLCANHKTIDATPNCRSEFSNQAHNFVEAEFL
jgi:hypothetical protein